MVLAETERIWTDVDGRTVTARVVRVDDNEVTIRRKGKEYTWPLKKLIPEDQAFLKKWKAEFEASRAERLKLVVSDESFQLTHRAYEKPADYLGGDLFQEYLKRTVPKYTEDMLAGLGYAITGQTAALYVPPNYDETQDFGVYVEVTAGGRGRVPGRDHQDVFEKHKLIYICPHGAGNKAVLSYRMGLALDALVTVKRHYRIDPKRCYVGGVSGGGISSTMIGYLRPEFFKGSVNIVRGALLENYKLEKAVKVRGTQGYAAGQIYPPFLPHLAGKHRKISQRYQDKRWAFVSGENDFNYEFAKVSGPQWTKHGYQAKYFHVPGMGHSQASGKTLDEVFTWMEM